MKIRILALVALGLSISFAGAEPKKDSFISAFKGTHNGTVIFAGIPGTTFGNFTASKKKETGTLILQSSIPSGGLTFAITEQFNFNKKSVTYTLIQNTGSTLVVPGFGTAKISKNKISYTIPFSFSGGSGVVFGTMTLAKNHHLTVQETLSFNSGTGVILYQLDGKKPKK